MGWHIDMDVLQAIDFERQRQNNKWGEQNHDDPVWLAILTEEVGEAAQAILHDRFGGKAAGTLEVELIHVAAVAVQWLEALQRRGYADLEPPVVSRPVIESAQPIRVQVYNPETKGFETYPPGDTSPDHARWSGVEAAAMPHNDQVSEYEYHGFSETHPAPLPFPTPRWFVNLTVKPTQTLTREKAIYIEGSASMTSGIYVHTQVIGVIDKVLQGVDDEGYIQYRVNFGGYGIWLVRETLIARFDLGQP